MTTMNFIFLILKTIFASISRIMLFSTWLYFTNEGQFSSFKTLIAYYLVFFILFLFNTFFNKSRPSCSSTFWTGIINILDT